MEREALLKWGIEIDRYQAPRYPHILQKACSAERKCGKACMLKGAIGCEIWSDLRPKKGNSRELSMRSVQNTDVNTTLWKPTGKVELSDVTRKVTFLHEGGEIEDWSWLSSHLNKNNRPCT